MTTMRAHLIMVASLICLAIVCFVTDCEASKYSKSSNTDKIQDIENEEKPFRMNKVNLLWAKGKKRLRTAKLGDLYAELVIQDKHEAHLKKARASSLDEDGAIEAKVHANYVRIVKHFGLDESPSSGKDFKVTNEVPGQDEIVFDDAKLQSMWKRAQEAGFSDKDLETLKEEFQHQQMKIDELGFIHRETGTNAALEDNVVDMDQLKLDLSEEKFRTLKHGRSELRKGYDRLENLVSSMPASEPQFSDHRVHRLWSMAKKTNWSEAEMDSFKEELKHFEHRISKHLFYKEQLDISSDKLESGGKASEKHQQLEEKTQFLDRTVNKLYSNLKMRVDEKLRHVEL